jgi:ABC-2 type transport system ATP-binding protein
MQPSPPLAVEARELTRTFGAFTAVDAISFSVAHGEVFGFLGPNGSGKTTTIRMLCGLLPQTSGLGRVLGFDIASQSEQIKSRIGYMSQKFSLYDDLTVAENLRFYSDVYGVGGVVGRRRQSELIDLIGLRGREGERASNLSGGWKQRLALACAIVHHPPMLFLDEPTGGVDPPARRDFWELIYTLAADGVTVFVTTHYMDEAEHCNRIGLMHNGRLVALDSPAGLKAQTIHGDVLEIEATAPDGGADWQAQAMPLLSALAGISEVASHGARLHAIMESAALPAAEVERALTAAGMREVHVAQIDPSLEDVFVTLMRTQA